MEQGFQEFPQERSAFRSTQKILIFISRNFQRRMEQHFPGFPKKKGAFRSTKNPGGNFGKVPRVNDTEFYVLLH